LLQGHNCKVDDIQAANVGIHETKQKLNHIALDGQKKFVEKRLTCRKEDFEGHFDKLSLFVFFYLVGHVPCVSLFIDGE